MKRLGQMRRWGSVNRDIHGRYYVARPLKRAGFGALVQQPEVVREDMARRNALIAFRKWRAKHPDGKAFFPKALFNALVAWDDISASEYFAQRAETEARGVSSTGP